jgi:hypothetical protein
LAFEIPVRKRCASPRIAGDAAKIPVCRSRFLFAAESRKRSSVRVLHARPEVADLLGRTRAKLNRKIKQAC